MNPVYLDHAASTPLKARALKALSEASDKAFANPSSAHPLGQELHERIERCRGLFLDFLSASADFRLVFTSSATEANNMIFHGLNREGRALFSEADHPSITEPAQKLWKSGTVSLREDGTVCERRLLETVSADTSLVALSHVNNQSGTVNEIGRLARALKLKKPDLHIHVDAAQSFGKFEIDLGRWPVDSLALSAHKMGGPKGVAALVLRDGIELKPLLFGGSHEHGLRASTQPFPLIWSWAAALPEKADLNGSLEKVRSLNRSLRAKLAGCFPEILFPFSGDGASPYILTVILPGIPSDLVLRHLAERKIYVSSTSACSSRIKARNPVFSALGIDERHHKNVLRISFSEASAENEVEDFFGAFRQIYASLKSLKGL